MPAKPETRVWDLPTRLFHWLLVLALIGAWLTGEIFTTFDYGRHKLIGYCILGLVLFRLIWGFVGGRYSRFAAFLRGPRTVLAYLAGRAPDRPGHNPLGALSVVAMLLSLLVQVASGLCADDGVLVAGPLANLAGAGLRDLAGAVHAVNVWILIGLIALHLLAVAYYALVRRRDLVKAMVTGRTRDLAAEPESRVPVTPSWGRALLALALAVGLVLLIVVGLPAWLPEAPGGGSFDFD